MLSQGEGLGCPSIFLCSLLGKEENFELRAGYRKNPSGSGKRASGAEALVILDDFAARLNVVPFPNRRGDETYFVSRHEASGAKARAQLGNLRGPGRAA